MIKNFYVPVEIYYLGKCYEGKKYHDVPDELADLISADPIFSKMKPQPQVDKFRHLRAQKLPYLKGQLQDYEDQIKRYEKQFALKQKMGEPLEKNQVDAYRRLSSEYEELKQYLVPIITAKEAEEDARRSKILKAAQARGTQIVFDKQGNWTEHFEPKRINI